MYSVLYRKTKTNYGFSQTKYLPRDSLIHVIHIIVSTASLMPSYPPQASRGRTEESATRRASAWTDATSCAAAANTTPASSRYTRGVPVLSSGVASSSARRASTRRRRTSALRNCAGFRRAEFGSARRRERVNALVFIERTMYP